MQTLLSNPIGLAFVVFPLIYFAQYLIGRKQSTTPQQPVTLPLPDPQLPTVVTPVPQIPIASQDVQKFFVAYQLQPTADRLGTFIEMAYHDVCTLEAEKRNKFNDLLDKMRSELLTMPADAQPKLGDKLIEGQAVTLTAEQAAKLNS